MMMLTSLLLFIYQRLLCALEGSYLEQEPNELGKDVDHLKGHDELHYLKFSCSIPEHIGRGFLEVCFLPSTFLSAMVVISCVSK